MNHRTVKIIYGTLLCMLSTLTSVQGQVRDTANASQPADRVGADATLPGVGFMTYNIRYLNNSDGKDVWANRRDAVAATIAKADVVGLQEVVAAQLSDIEESVSEFDWYGIGRNDGKADGEMVPIGWRKSIFEAIDQGTFWLSTTPEQIASVGWDAALPRIASWVRLKHKALNREFLFVNTHFDHRGNEARRQSALLLRKWIGEHRQGLQVIVTGDLNSRLNTPPLDALLAETSGMPTLQNTRTLSSVPDPGPNSTWNGFKAIQEGQRIDFVLCTESGSVISYETLNPLTATGRFASDHLPVLVRMDLGK